MRMRFLKLARDKYKNASVTIKAAFWFTVCNFAQKAISFVTLPLFTRLMSTEDFGYYSVYTSWYSILTIFATLNLHTYVFNKAMVKFPDDRDGFIVSVQSLSTISTILVFILYCVVNLVKNDIINISSTMMICMFLQLLFEPSILYWYSIKRYKYEYRGVVILTIIIALLNPLLGVILIKLMHNAPLARVLSVSLIAVMFGAVLYAHFVRQGKKSFNTKYWKYALSFNIPLIPHYLSITVLNQADRIMINKYVGSSAAAIYSVAYAVSVVPVMINTATQQSFLPWLYDRLENKKYSKIKFITNTILSFVFAIIIILVVLAPEIISIVGTKDYYAAIWIVPPVCTSVLFVAIENMFANIEYYFEETKYVAFASVGVALLNVVLNAIFIPLYGYIAAGYTTLVSYIVYAVAHYFVVRFVTKKHKFNGDIIDIKFILLLSIIAIVSMITLTVFYELLFVRIAIVLTCILVLYLFKDKVRGAIYELKSRK